MGVEKPIGREHAFAAMREGIRTERLLIRTPRTEDAAALWEAIDESREHLAPWIHWLPHYRTPRDAEHFIEGAGLNFASRHELFLGMYALDEPGRFLGGTGFHNIEWEIPAFEIGYWLRASAVGQGLMTEAVAAQTAFVVERFGAKRVAITCDAANERSAAVPRRLGFTEEGHLRNAGLTPTGAVRDTLVFAVTGWSPSARSANSRTDGPPVDPMPPDAPPNGDPL